MRDSILQNLRTRLQGISKKRTLHIMKILVIFGLIIGFGSFCFLGKAFVEGTALLDADALKEIRDNTIDKGEFLRYVLARRLLVLGAGVLAWWWGFGKLYMYGIWGGCSIVMGACLYISLMRYPFTGLFLWFFLYFPHMIFYAGVIFCGMILTAAAVRGREEKVKYLWQSGLVVCVLVGLYAVGIYCECYINVPLLQLFLEYF